MAIDGDDTQTSVRNSSFLDSTTSSSYELDLPPLPAERGVLHNSHPPPSGRVGHKPHPPTSVGVGHKPPVSSRLDPVSPIYTNLNKILSASTQQDTVKSYQDAEETHQDTASPTSDHLSTVMEDQSTDDSDMEEIPELCVNRRTNGRGQEYSYASEQLYGNTPSLGDTVEQLYSNTPPLSINTGKLHGNTPIQPRHQDRRGVVSDHKYTTLRKSTLDDSDTYALPSSSETRPLSYTSVTYDTPPSNEADANAYSTQTSSSVHLVPFPEYTEHQTSYVKLSPDTESGNGNKKQNRSRSLKNRNRNRDRNHDRIGSLPWRIRESYSRHMKAVDMMGCCWATKHRKAKKFFACSLGLLFILVLALGGVVIAALAWSILQKGANSIEEDLDSHVVSFNRCGVGRNWTSVEINVTSHYEGPHLLRNSEVYDISLSNLTMQRVGMPTDSLGAQQLLLYLVLQINGSNTANMSALGTSFINVALWTKTESDRLFQQYMSLLNGLSTPQITARSFWFPLKGTNKHFYARAVLISDDDQEQMSPISIRVYLVGYC